MVASSAWEVDPTLADAPPCASIRQADSGRCIVTDELLARADSDSATVIAPEAPSAAPAAPAASHA